MDLVSWPLVGALVTVAALRLRKEKPQTFAPPGPLWLRDEDVGVGGPVVAFLPLI